MSQIAATGSLAEPGDHFHACDRLVVRTVLYMRAVYGVEERARVFRPLPDRDVRWHVHRLSAPGRAPESSIPSTSPDGGRPPRLFLFEPRTGEGRIRCDWTLPPISAVLEAHWPEHELVAGFDQGRVYVLNEWAARQ